MQTFWYKNLDPLTHGRVRFAILCVLNRCGQSNFRCLKEEIGATDGNLGAHLQKLIRATYVETTTQADGGEAGPVYRMTLPADMLLSVTSNS